MFIKDLLPFITYKHVKGDENLSVSKLLSFDPNNLDRNILMWVNEKNVHKVTPSTKGILICPLSLTGNFSEEITLIFTEHPRRAFKEVIKVLYGNTKPAHYTSPTAIIHESVQLPSNVTIGHHVVIEENCLIKEGVKIGHNSIIHANTIIKENVSIGTNCTIGGIGFGYEKNKHGQFEQILHIGNVIIEENVEIGNNTCIDRAVLGSTKIGKNVKIDNLVHISHGVKISENALIIANSMIAGSVEIGKNTWVAPSSCVLNKTTIGDDVTIGMGAVVIRSVKNNDVVVGNPAKSIRT